MLLLRHKSLSLFSRRLLLLSVFCVLISACGQTGPLKLPEKDTHQEATK